ncbi:RagB/SusD family nutrient uptake outer membrane protein [Bacteroidota bacterium]
MKKIINLLTLIFLLAGFIFISNSCSEEFFDTPTGNSIKPSNHYEYYIDAELSYFGCFVFLQDLVDNLVLVNGLRSDIMDVTENADRDMIDINNHVLTTTNPYLDPSVYYKIIINVNEVIPNLPGILEKDKDFDSTRLYAYTGALVTLRSWCYFVLARLNGEVGYIEGNLTEVDPSKPPKYYSKAEIIDILIRDLIPYYDDDDIFRFAFDHLALLGELYLEKNDYAKAIRYFKKCIDGDGSPGYMVNTDYGTRNWGDIFINSVSQFETVITAVPFSYKDGQPNILEVIFKDYYMVKPSSLIINAYNSQVPLTPEAEPGDIYRGEGITYDYNGSDEPVITKYSLEEGDGYSADVCIYRDADIHLLLAEALNRNGDSENALVLLNLGMSQASNRPDAYARWSSNAGVRGRVSLQAVSASSVEAVEDLIIQERALELAFEGKRWFDLVRIASRRNDPSYLANKVAAKFDDPAKAEQIRSKLMDTENWYLPLSKISE